MSQFICCLVGFAGVVWISVRFIRLWRTGTIEMNDVDLKWKDHPIFFVIAVLGHLAIFYGCLRALINILSGREVLPSVFSKSSP
jgi:hypothetical protein